ncbi:hypothetical protein EZS27_003381 [termite gut metagenome]|uniref:Uncharacterized protein n=1 Tax=termite gut metagenome TaxID=433724 RepID=A0A5J4SSL1_9ZZZZ
MKSTILFLIVSLTFVSANAQTKKISYEYNRFLSIKGTEYSVATVESWSKFKRIKSNLLFINTKTGETKQIDFPDDANLRTITQIKLDSLNINVVLIVANTIDWNDKKGIEWNDPMQIFISSPSGNEMQQLTENNYSVNTWSINEFTGTLIVSGYFDTNKNNKKDTNEENAILLYDLTTLKLKKQL